MTREAVAYWTSLIRVGDWLALVPATPDPIVAAHRQAFHEIVNDPEFAERIKTAFPEVVEMTGTDLAKIAGDLAQTSPRALAYLSRLGIRSADNLQCALRPRRCQVLRFLGQAS